MFKFVNIYTDLIHVSKVQGNPAKSKITYFLDGKIETQTFADSSEYDEVMDNLEQKFITIGGVLYNPNRISVVKVNGLSVGFYFNGGKIITETYADESEVDEVIQKIEPTYIEVKPSVWISGDQLHVASVNETILEIKYDYLGGEVFDVIYEDQSTYDDAIAKLENLGEGGGSGPVTKKVATPRFSPAAGGVPSGTTVTITCSTDGAAIHYTIDGTTPTASSPTYSSPIAITADTTIKAIGVKTGLDNSSVATASYTIVLPKAANPTFSPAAGEVLSGTEVSMSCATTGADIFYTTDGSVPTSASTKYTAPIAVTAAITFKAIAIAEGYQDSSVVTAAYTIGIPTAAAPTFTPNGGEVPKGSTVVLATTTPGGVIHYTTNGSTPTASSPAYTDPIAINAATTIKAITIADGYKNSSVVTKNFTVPAVVLYKYAGVFNNPDEDTDIEPVASDITLEWLEALTDKKKLAATSKEYGSMGNEQVFDGISEDNGGRVIYSYPASLGNLTSYIQNGVTQAIGNSFDKLVSTVDGEEYYTYVLRNSNASPTLTYAFV